MPDYLLTKDWKKVLEDKDHKAVKKTGISETLDAWAKVAKKDDKPKKLSALQDIVAKAREVKGKHSKFAKMVSYLDQMILAARTQIEDLNAKVAEIKDNAGDGDDGVLGKALKKVKTVTDPKDAWNFVLVPGKPSSGFVVVKTSVKKADLDSAFEMRGKRGPYLQGKIYYAAPEFILLIEDKPLPGSAKAAKSAAALHAKLNGKFVIRSPQGDLKDEDDIDMMGDDGILGDEVVISNDVEDVFRKRIEKIADALANTQGGPKDRLEGALDGIAGMIKIMGDQITAEKSFDEEKREELRNLLKIIARDAKNISAPDQGVKGAEYPNRDYWTKMAQGILRLDIAKREEGWKRFLAAQDKVQKQLDDDETLDPETRRRVQDDLTFALDEAEKYVDRASDLQLESINLGDKKLDQIFLAMERKFSVISETPGLVDPTVEQATLAFRKMRYAFSKGNIDKVDQVLKSVGRMMEAAYGIALAFRKEQGRVKGQTEMNEVLKPSMELIRKAVFPNTIIKDPEAVRKGIKDDIALRKMLEAGSALSKSLTAQTVKDLDTWARTCLAAIEDRARSGTSLPSDAMTKGMAEESLARAAMARMSLDYENLPQPPWTQEQAETATRIQAELFFVESSLHSFKDDGQGGGPVPVPYSMPTTGGLDTGEGGVNGSWWIERTEMGGKKGKRKYIFKPGEREAPVRPGLPVGGGAPREVLAKRLDEALVGVGIDPGVSQTTLISLDKKILGEGGEGTLNGSIQDLAPNQGDLKAMVQQRKLGDLAPKISAKNFEDIAVFDMIFANLDRHGGNLLMQTDEVTGQVKLLPIDHGASLTDPESLYAGRSFLSGGGNVMLDPGFAVFNQKPLSPETMESLSRLDPDALVASMKQSRDKLGQTNPETQGKVDDKAVDAMANRIRFMKVAGATMSIAEMMTCLGECAVEIGTAKATDFPGIARTIVQTYVARQQKKKEAGRLLDVLGEATASSQLAAGKILQDLGWAWNMVPSALTQWMAANAELTTRILKLKLENPQYESELNRLKTAARLNKPDIDKEFANKNRRDAIMLAYEWANADVMVPVAKDKSREDLQKMLDKVATPKDVTDMVTALPSSAPQPPFPETEVEWRQHLRNAIGNVSKWLAIKQRGGLSQYIATGGEISSDTQVVDVLLWLEEREISTRGRDDILQMDAQRIDQAALQQLTQLRQRLALDIMQVANIDTRVKIFKSLEVGTKQLDDGDLTAAGLVLTFTDRTMAEQFEKQDKNAELMRQKLQELHVAYTQLPETAKAEILEDYNTKVDEMLLDQEGDLMTPFNNKAGELANLIRSKMPPVAEKKTDTVG